MTEALGWASSFVLLATIVQQVAKQWQERSTRGVSKWLFIGQTAASLGFTLYSVLLRNWVFAVTNGLLLVSAIVGVVLTFHFKRRTQPPPAAAVLRAAP
jgi:MtN3 and saliva related transmembrane protein